MAAYSPEAEARGRYQFRYTVSRPRECKRSIRQASRATYFGGSKPAACQRSAIAGPASAAMKARASVQQ